MQKGTKFIYIHISSCINLKPLAWLGAAHDFQHMQQQGETRTAHILDHWTRPREAARVHNKRIELMALYMYPYIYTYASMYKYIYIIFPLYIFSFCIYVDILIHFLSRINPRAISGSLYIRHTTTICNSFYCFIIFYFFIISLCAYRGISTVKWVLTEHIQDWNTGRS